MIHRHHIIPIHAGGTDEPSNIEFITTEEHAERHRILFESQGRWQDEIAWKCLSGQIGNDEAIRQAGIKANTGKKMSDEFKRNQSIRMMGNKIKLGKKATESFKLICAERMTGNRYARGKGKYQREEKGVVCSI
jgi:hypothetical protein